jgi:hypothetical protein
VTQLKGVKLVAWTLVLAIGQNSLDKLVRGYWPLPALDDNFLRCVAGDPWPRLVGWARLIKYFAEDLLGMS